MSTIEVVAAIICKEGKYFATQRGYGEFEGWWEFPGGKIEPCEGKEDALKREILEELGVEIIVGKQICTTEYDYPAFHLKMHCFLCTLAPGAAGIQLLEHKSARWLSPDELEEVGWLPADKDVIEMLKESI